MVRPAGHGGNPPSPQAGRPHRTGRQPPGRAVLMAKMRRKTLIVCAPCHRAIHGKPAATCTSALPESRMHYPNCPSGSDRGSPKGA